MDSKAQFRPRTVAGRVTACFMAMLLSLIAACGPDQVAGIEGSGAPVASAVTTTGRISGFGSVFVDGVEYDTATAQIRIDDRPATEADLRVGHVVTITGTVDPEGKAGTATQVTLTSDVRGDVGSVDVAANTFVVLGQIVKVTADTLFDASVQAEELAALKPGTEVRVSGFASSTGELLASRIDGVVAAAAAPDVQVKGKIKALDTIAKSFRVNNLVVDYRSANVSGSLSEGSETTVHGTTSADGSTLVASEVSIATSQRGNSGEKGHLEGLITSFDSNASFVVDGQPISTNSSTTFNLHDLALGADVFVRVRGMFDNSHVLVADQVEAKPSPASLVRGTVDAISAVDSALTVMGVKVKVSAATTFDDQGNDKKRQFGLADIRVGDYVEVRGSAGPGEPIAASIVQRARGQDRSLVQGVAEAFSPPSLKVLGLIVTTDGNTSFPGLGGGAKGSEAFFEQAAGKIVNVRGTMNGDTLVADQIRIVAQ